MKELTTSQLALLKKPLPPEATKPRPDSQLSSINSIYVTERLNEVFGVGGWSLRADYVTEDKAEVTTAKGTKVKTNIVVKVIFEAKEYGVYFESFGGNYNPQDIGDSYKGAVTDGLTKIASWLGIGAHVWKNDPKGVNEPAPKVAALTDADLDNTERCNKMLEKVYGYYLQAPDTFTVDRFIFEKVPDTTYTVGCRFIKLFSSYKQAHQHGDNK
jgi:hypothetical protein